MNRNENREHIREELAELSPTLAKLQGSSDGVRIPMERLDNLADEVMARIAQEDKTGLRRVSALRVWRMRAAVAAGISILIAAGWWGWGALDSSPAPQMQLAELSDEEIDTYIYNNLEDFDLNLLIESGIVSEEDAPLLPANATEVPADKNLQDYLDQAQDELDDESYDALF